VPGLGVPYEDASLVVDGDGMAAPRRSPGVERVDLVPLGTQGFGDTRIPHLKLHGFRRAVTPPRGVEGFVQRELPGDQVGDDLEVELDLEIARGDPADRQGAGVPHEHPRVEGVQRALAAGDDVWVALVEAEAEHAAVEQGADL